MTPLKAKIAPKHPKIGKISLKIPYFAYKPPHPLALSLEYTPMLSSSLYIRMSQSHNIEITPSPRLTLVSTVIFPPGVPPPPPPPQHHRGKSPLSDHLTTNN